MWGPGMGLGSGTGHIRLGPGPWAMIPSRQPGHGFETAGPSVLPPPSLVSAFATCCVPRLLQQVELHAVWLLQPVRLPLSVTVIGICPKTKQYNRWYSKLQLGGWLLQPVNRCCSHCNEIQGASEYETSLVQSLVLKIAASWAAVPAGCANEFQTMLWGCSSRHSKVGSISCIFECWAAVPAGYDIYNNGYLFCSSSKAAVGPRVSLRKRRAHVAGIFGPKCC